MTPVPTGFRGVADDRESTVGTVLFPNTPERCRYDVPCKTKPTILYSMRMVGDGQTGHTVIYRGTSGRDGPRGGEGQAKVVSGSRL